MNTKPSKKSSLNRRGLIQGSALFGELPPRDGKQYDCQCARCGSSIEWEQCCACGGEGITGPGELYEEDPLWYDIDDYEPCHECDGHGSWGVCLSSPEWCNANPLPRREDVKRGTIEWYLIPMNARAGTRNVRRLPEALC